METGANVKIKGFSGTEFQYENVPKVWLAAQESTDDNPVLVPFTYGEALENVPVVPDFSQGDMLVTMPDGYLARSAVAIKPEMLIPENIVEGVTIAGVEGKFKGGSNAKFASGVFTGTGAAHTINHGLGVVPDVVVVWAAYSNVSYLRNVVGFSSQILKLTGFTAGQFFVCGSSSNSGNQTAYIECTYQTMALHDANEQTVVVGGSSTTTGYPEPKLTYRWFAIAGIT